MLFTLLNWLYILITCFICGFFVLTRIYKGKVSFGGSVMCGIAVLTAYSEYFSLIEGVGIAANAVLVVACLVFAVTDREKIADLSKSYISRLKNMNKGSLIKAAFIALSAAVILVCAYFTAASAFTYDTGTYHAQSIHWIESYGVVKGLAHMQTRLGFNNSYFALCALYSFHFFGRSMHALSGFLAAFVMVYCLCGYARLFTKDADGKLKIRGLRVSDFVRVAPFAYFMIIATEITSPATDFGVILMIIWLIIRWIECIEDGDDQISVFALLSVFSVFLITVKLSVGVLALVTIWPLVYLIREKKIADIFKYAIYGIVLTLPFFIRNYLITGWLVYPFPGINLFNPDWKVPLEGVRHEADEVVVWARYTKDTALIDQGIREWFPVWWQEQGSANRWLSVSAFVGFLVTLAGMLPTPVFKMLNKIYIFTGGILLVCFAFFMLSAPSNRFGYAYILTLPLYGAGYFCLKLIPGFIKSKKGEGTYRAGQVIRIIMTAVVIIVTLTGFLKGLRMFASDDKRYALDTGMDGCLVSQRDYPEADSGSRDWEGMTIYYPVIEGDQIWYHDFPAILYGGNLDGVERRGDSVRDGFRLK